MHLARKCSSGVILTDTLIEHIKLIAEKIKFVINNKLQYIYATLV